jgi:hypothetical protein
MKKALAMTLAIAVLAGPALASAGQSAVAKTYRLSATMTARQVVTVKNKKWTVPAGVAHARGTFAGTFDNKTRRLTWRITYTEIGRSALAIADIHVGPPGKFGAIITRLCGSCEPGQSGVKTIKRGFVTDITSGRSWVTVITDRYPNGVIRGQIKVR